MYVIPPPSSPFPSFVQTACGEHTVVTQIFDRKWRNFCTQAIYSHHGKSRCVSAIRAAELGVTETKRHDVVGWCVCVFAHMISLARIHISIQKHTLHSQIQFGWHYCCCLYYTIPWQSFSPSYLPIHRYGIIHAWQIGSSYRWFAFNL